MDNIELEQFHIIGIDVRTTNENGQASTDIPQLWGRFMGENIIAQIPGKIDNDIYCVYTYYEKDHTKPYTTILGCKVTSLENIPDGMVGKTIDATTYQLFTAKGNLTQGAVFNKWIEIWRTDLPRKYSADFEIYSAKASNMEDGEVDIYIGLK